MEISPVTFCDVLDSVLIVHVHYCCNHVVVLLKIIVGELNQKKRIYLTNSLASSPSNPVTKTLCLAVDVQLDPSTAHPRLIVSADGKEVQDGSENQWVLENPQRFDLCASVLGRNPLTSGKAYWQVAVGDKVGWDLGVTSVDSQRKGKVVFEPGTNYWVMVHYDGQGYAAMTAPPQKLTLKAKPKMVGVFLDYEEGLVSFYDLTSSSHIFSFTACSFRGELRPYFSPHNEEKGEAQPLVILV